MQDLICNKCGFIGTTNKKQSEKEHREVIKGHEPEYVHPDVYFGRK